VRHNAWRLNEASKRVGRTCKSHAGFLGHNSQLPAARHTVTCRLPHRHQPQSIHPATLLTQSSRLPMASYRTARARCKSHHGPAGQRSRWHSCSSSVTGNEAVRGVKRWCARQDGLRGPGCQATDTHNTHALTGGAPSACQSSSTAGMRARPPACQSVPWPMP
jgi:hypothetical protein